MMYIDNGTIEEMRYKEDFSEEYLNWAHLQDLLREEQVMCSAED